MLHLFLKTLAVSEPVLPLRAAVSRFTEQVKGDVEYLSRKLAEYLAALSAPEPVQPPPQPSGLPLLVSDADQRRRRAGFVPTQPATTARPTSHDQARRRKAFPAWGTGSTPTFADMVSGAGCAAAAGPADSLRASQSSHGSHHSQFSGPITGPRDTVEFKRGEPGWMRESGTEALHRTAPEVFLVEAQLSALVDAFIAALDQVDSATAARLALRLSLLQRELFRKNARRTDLPSRSEENGAPPISFTDYLYLGASKSGLVLPGYSRNSPTGLPTLIIRFIQTIVGLRPALVGNVDYMLHILSENFDIAAIPAPQRDDDLIRSSVWLSEIAKTLKPPEGHTLLLDLTAVVEAFPKRTADLAGAISRSARKDIIWFFSLNVDGTPLNGSGLAAVVLGGAEKDRVSMIHSRLATFAFPSPIQIRQAILPFILRLDAKRPLSGETVARRQSITNHIDGRAWMAHLFLALHEKALAFRVSSDQNTTLKAARGTVIGQLAEGLGRMVIDPIASQELSDLLFTHPDIRQRILDIGMRTFQSGCAYLEALNGLEAAQIEGGFEAFFEHVIMMMQILNPRPFDQTLSDLYAPKVVGNNIIAAFATPSGSQSFLNALLASKAYGIKRVMIQGNFYYEHLSAVCRGMTPDGVRVIKFDWRRGLAKLPTDLGPCVIITDVVPNDAAQTTDRNVPLSHIVDAILQRQALTVLIVDVTTVPYDDPAVLDCIRRIQTNPNIALVLVNSLSKMVQHGADRLQAGGLVVIGNTKIAGPFLSALKKLHALTPLPPTYDRMLSLLHTATRPAIDQRFTEAARQAAALYGSLSLPPAANVPMGYVGLAVAERTQPSPFVALHTAGVVESLPAFSIPPPVAKIRLAILLAHVLYIRLRHLGVTKRMSFGFACAAISDAGLGIRIACGEADTVNLAPVIHALNKELAKLSSDSSQQTDLRTILLWENRKLEYALNEIADPSLSLAQLLAALAAQKPKHAAQRARKPRIVR